MRRKAHNFALYVVLSAAIPSVAAQPEGAYLSLVADRDDPVWFGEKVEIHLELWTQALSFSGVTFTLPEVQGGYLLQPDSNTVNMSERRDGAAWQGLRYSFNLYPQRAGDVQVPAFEVRFATSAGYGSDPQPYSFHTRPLTVESLLPPGADAGALLVTTADFSLDAAWSIVPSAEGRVERVTGDALVLTVERRAAGVPGMVFEPLPDMEFDGLGVYADAPVVNDRVYRGNLSGSRTDRVTVVCELPGTYSLPALEFQWWDPQKERLNVERVPPVTVVVEQNPGWSVAAASAEPGETIRLDRRFFWLVPAALLLWWPGWPLVRAAGIWLREELAATQLEPLNPSAPRSTPR